MSPKDRRRDAWTRRAAALAAVTVGGGHLLLAATTHPPRTHRFLVVDYALSTVIGARYVVLVLGLSLVLVARSLLHGKHAAWWIALVAALGTIPGHHVKEADTIGALTAIALVVVLLAGRRSFHARSDPALVRRGWYLLGIGLATVFVYAFVGLSTLDQQFRHTPTFSAARNAARLLFLLPADSALLTTRHGIWFVESVRFATVLVVLTALVRLIGTVLVRASRSASDATRVRAVLEQWGTTSLAHFALLDDKLWFFSDDDDAVIAYKLIGRRNALALGDPIGSPEGRASVASAFVTFCDDNGWVPAFHQVTDDGAAVLSGAGLLALKIGEEAVVPVQEWDIEAKQYKSLRSALRRVERAGYQLVEVPTPIPDDTMDELRVVSDQWLHSGGHRERTFTLGRFEPDQLQATTIVAAVDAKGDIGAFANVLPRYQSAEGNFDLMRRRPDSPNGIMDFIFVGLIRRFRSEGATGMNLGLAPLSGLDDSTVTSRALQLLYERGGSAFNFEGLRSFKDKWGPRWEPRYLCYRQPSELLGVAAAVVRAGELPDERRPLQQLVAVARKFPFSLAVFGVALWFMLASTVEPDIHKQLFRHLGMSWRDLQHLQLWRFATSQLVQTTPGMVWSNVILLLLLLPLAEWRLGTRRSVVVFALADWLTTLPLLILIRIAAAFGDSSAADMLIKRDGGSSAGAWGLAGALAWSLRSKRHRFVALGTMVAIHLALYAWQRELFDIQHACAVVAGAGLVAAAAQPNWWRRRARLEKVASSETNVEKPVEPAATDHAAS